MKLDSSLQGSWEPDFFVADWRVRTALGQLERGDVAVSVEARSPASGSPRHRGGRSVCRLALNGSFGLHFRDDFRDALALDLGRARR